jgi:DnaJ family protein C protein 7
VFKISLPGADQEEFVVFQVDVDDQPYLSKSENVSFVPTFKIYKNGSNIRELAGPTHQDLERAINPFSS